MIGYDESEQLDVEQRVTPWVVKREKRAPRAVGKPVWAGWVGKGDVYALVLEVGEDGQAVVVQFRSWSFINSSGVTVPFDVVLIECFDPVVGWCHPVLVVVTLLLEGLLTLVLQGIARLPNGYQPIVSVHLQQATTEGTPQQRMRSSLRGICDGGETTPWRWTKGDRSTKAERAAKHDRPHRRARSTKETEETRDAKNERPHRALVSDITDRERILMQDIAAHPIQHPENATNASI